MSFSKKHRNWLLVFIAAIPVVAFYLIFGCPFRFFTGISCLGCGMSRALLCLLQFDFVSAFKFHPLIFIMPIVGVLFLLRKRFSKKTRTILAYTFFGVMVVVYIIRFFGDSDVVYADISQSFVLRLLSLFREGVR